MNNSKIKKFLIFSQKKTFYKFSQPLPIHALSCFSPQKPALKFFLYFFRKTPNVLEMETSKKSLYFRKQNILSNNFPRLKFFNTFSNKEAKYFKSKYFLIYFLSYKL